MTLGINGSIEFKKEIEALEKTVEGISNHGIYFGSEVSDFHDHCIGESQDNWDGVLVGMIEEYLDMCHVMAEHKEALAKLVDASSEIPTTELDYKGIRRGA